MPKLSAQKENLTALLFPQPETDNNVFAVTNKEKLDKILDRQQYIPTKEAQDLAESFPFLKELNIPVTAKRAIITESGQLILGKYSRAMIEFVQNPKKTTVPPPRSNPRFYGFNAYRKRTESYHRRS